MESGGKPTQIRAAALLAIAQLDGKLRQDGRSTTGKRCAIMRRRRLRGRVRPVLSKILPIVEGADPA